jgi:hypothetical protein
MEAKHPEKPEPDSEPEIEPEPIQNQEEEVIEPQPEPVAEDLKCGQNQSASKQKLISEVKSDVDLAPP